MPGMTEKDSAYATSEFIFIGRCVVSEQKVLIIDDDPGLRKTLSDILKAKGYETVTALGGAEGIAALEKGFMNIVIIDLALPDMPGINVLERPRNLLRRPRR